MIQIAKFPKGTKKAVTELQGSIAGWLGEAEANGAVLGLSGGVDSLVTAFLWADTMNHLRSVDTTERVLWTLGMPSETNTESDNRDGWRAYELLRERFPELDVRYKIIDIQALAEPFWNLANLFGGEGLDQEKLDFHKGSLYSELRAVVLSRYAARFGLLVAGTGNYDEDEILGYFNKRGDGSVDNNVLGNLPKYLVKEVGRYYGLPGYLVERVPSAGLQPGQTDEKELGFSYDTAYRAWRAHVQGLTLPQMVDAGLDVRDVAAVLAWHEKTEHKRRLPPVGEVTLDYV